MDLSFRQCQATLTVTDAAGKPLANAPISVEMTRHKFLFGCNAYALGSAGDPALEQEYRKRFCDLLNYATLPFYWGSYEPQLGQTRQEIVAENARWCQSHWLHTKGHPLVWHEIAPKWAMDMPPEEVERLQWERITREVSGFAGLIDRWDVINETAVMPRHQPETNPITKLCNRLGRIPLIKKVFDLARAANPSATLVLNDFNTGEEFQTIIDECLGAGVDFDVIGIQSHMHRGYWGRDQVTEVCQKFSRFCKPLHFTEATLVSGALKTDDDWHGPHPGWDSTPEGEARQAEEAADFYSVLFGHPAVEALTWWDFSDAHAWQGAPAGLLHKDMSPKPAYDALMKLIRKEWWTGPLKKKTDPAGKVQFTGFLGDYYVRAGGKEAIFRVDNPGEAVIAMELAKL
jgi:GH35 family endo-1,4-beta-xylanase